MVAVALLLAYLIGAAPMGYIVIKVVTGKDVTNIGSGRTGGTNAMRAGGFYLGLLVSLLDLGKGFLSVWIASTLFPETFWLHALAATVAVLGHNWSVWVYLISGKFAGGAGTGPNVGAAIAFWPPIGLILVPTVFVFVLIVGYASLASILAALLIPTIFAIRYFSLNEPFEYIIYGLATTIFVIISLRPNIRRLFAGTERRVGIFAKTEKK